MQKNSPFKFFLLFSFFFFFIIMFNQNLKRPLDETLMETEVDAAGTTVAQIQNLSQSSDGKATFHNMIDKKMITYHKGFFSLTPEFTLTVNDQIVKPNQSITALIENGIVEIAYAYNFMGHKKGKKSIRFKIPTDKNEFDITFSWKKDPRIIINGAEVLEVKELY